MTDLNPLRRPPAASERLDAVFVNPSFGYPIIKDKGLFYTKMWPPLSLAYCAAIMEQAGQRVKIIDAQVERLGPDIVAEQADGAARVFLSSSPLDRWQCPVNDIGNVYAVIKALRAAVPDRMIYLIGAHGTTSPEKVLEETSVDAVLLGEPEATVGELAEGRPLDEVDGVAYRKGDGIVVRPRRRFLSPNQFPLPAFHLLPMEKYYFEFMGRHFSVLELSRGCPFGCTFCYKDMYGPYRIKTSEKIIRELDYAIDEFGVRNIYFTDLTFTVARKQVADMCDHLIARKSPVRWACQTRVDVVDKALLRKMRDAGCRLIQFGVESGSEDILRTTKKDITFTSIEEGLKNAHDLGMESVAFFMFGLPGETEDDMRRNIRLANKLNPTYVAYNIAIPYNEIRLSAQSGSAENEGVFFADTYPPFTKASLDAMVRKGMISFYLHPRTIPKVLRHPGSLFRKTKIFLAVL